jgi:choline monooxygenase
MADAVSTLPADWYVDGARYEHERRSVFAHEWVWFTHAAAVVDPGSYVAQTYAGWPLMVMRSADGELRGFHNVCRHRAGPLVDDGAGTCGNLVCQYHGWAYEPDGKLRSARDFGEAPDADEFALHAIHVAEWRGQVFVNLAATTTALDDDLAEFFAESDGFPLEAMTLVRAFRHDLACNWKTYADNYLEGYHIPLLHPELQRQYDTKQYRVELGDRYCRHTAPRRADAAEPGMAQRGSHGGRDGGEDDGRWLFRWPNLALNVYGDSMNVEVIVPTGSQTCSVLYNHFFVDPDAADVDDVIAFSDLVMQQDQRMVEAVQRNLASGVYNAGVLSPRHEGALEQFQSLIRKAGSDAL